MSEQTIRILVADDHSLLREALCDMLGTEAGIEVVAQAADAQSAIRLAAQTRPDVALLDVQMPHNEDPLAMVRRIQHTCPDLRIIIVSMDDSPLLVRQLLAHGVAGYVHKSASWETLAAVVREPAGLGRKVVTVSLPPQPATDRAGAQPLSEREIEVLTLVAMALSNRQVGARLGITEGTVKRHLRNLFDKLDAVSRIDAVNKAVSFGIIRPHRPHRVPA